jgi:hypothetical protein
LGYFFINTDTKKVTHGTLTIAAQPVQVISAFAKSNDPIKSRRLKEIAMNTDKVIELGAVSEETKGVIGEAESLIHPFFAEPV